MAAASDSTGFAMGVPTPRQRLRVLLVDPNPARREQLLGWLADHYEVHAAGDADAALARVVDIVPSVLIVDASTGRADCLIERSLEELSVFEIGVMMIADAGMALPPSWRQYARLRRPFTREQLLEGVAGASAPHLASAAALRHAQQRREEAEALLDLALDLTSRHDLRELLQRATDAATQLTGAAFGAFFYNAIDDHGQHYLLYTLSGAPMSAFAHLGPPRNTPLFAATFAGERIVRSDDILADSLYGTQAPHHGMPPGHLPVRSYLAVPVVSRSETLGGMFFGHPEPAMFSRRSERVAAAIAAQAAIAIDNTQLLSAMQQEIARREQMARDPRRP